MTVYGYARVSTVEQTLDAQVDALRASGIDAEHIYTDKISGSKDRRPGLDALLARLDSGDVVTIYKLDRLGRSTSHLVQLMDEWRERGIHLRSLDDGLDTTTSQGRFYVRMLAALAELERDRTRERTALALDARRRRGARLGRPSRVTWEQYEAIHRLEEEGRSHESIRRTVGLSKAVVGRVLRGEIESLAPYAERLRKEAETGGDSLFS